MYMTHLRYSSEDLVSGDELLSNDAGDSDHGKPTIVEFLVLQREQGLGMRGSQVQRIEIQVAVLVALPQGRYPGAVLQGSVDRLPAPEDVDGLHNST